MDARQERLVAQLGAAEHRDRHQRALAQRASRFVHVLGVDSDLLHQEGADALRRPGGDLQPHARAEAALADLAVDDRQQVVRLVLEDCHVHVARDPERVAAQDLHAGEQIAEVRRDELLERQELLHVLASLAGLDAQARERDEARQALRHLDPRELLLVGVRVARLHRQRQRQVRQERKRVAGIDAQRGQHREDRPPKVPLPQLLRLGVQRLPVAQVDALRRQPGQQVVRQQLRCDVELAPQDVANLGQLLAGAEPVGAGFDHRGLELLVQARDPDHEKFVEVRGEDRQELQALEQRPVRAQRLAQHPFIERQPRDLAVDVQRAIIERRRAPLRRLAHRIHLRGDRCPVNGRKHFWHGHLQTATLLRGPATSCLS